MAQNSRDPNLPNGIFNDGLEAFNYHNVYHGQGFGSNLTADQGLPDVHSPYDANPYQQHTSSWQHPATSTPNFAATQQSPLPYVNPGRGYYGVPASSTPTPFQNNPSFANHGLQQYSHSLDPSLVSPVGDHSRAYSHTVPTYSSTAPSSTIAPAALHPGTYLNGGRQDQSPATQMVNQARPSSATATAQTQLVKAPKGIASGDFIIVDYDALAKVTQSQRLHNFVNIGRFQHELPLNKTTIPPYVPRKSMNEIRMLAASDPNLRAKIAKRTKKFHVPKLPRPNSTGQSPASLSSESDSSDYDSDSSYESEPEPEKFPLLGPRPSDALGAIRYDTAKAVFLPRNVFAENEDIRSGLKNLWEVIKTIRDRWKTDSEAVKTAAEAKKISELPMLQDRVKNQRDLMEVALKASIEFGHPDLMRACGGVKQLMFALYQFFTERVRENDYDSLFTKTLFKFLTLCTGLSTESIEATNLNKIFGRYAKRGDDEIKAMVASISENAAAESKKAKAKGANSADGSDTTKPLATGKATDKKPELVAGAKRPRPADATVIQPTKRVASGSTVPAAKESAAAKLGLLKAKVSTNPEKAVGSSTAASAVKSKGHQVVSKAPTNFFSSLQSASKKPGTSLAAAAAKPKTAANGLSEKKAAAPAAPMKSGFSFAETMANLAKAREPEPSAKPVETRPPETAEEKAKRLRKEERRKLRVTWKPDKFLVQIKEFQLDPSEMPGNNNNVRDVRDGKEKEGLMFKQHMEMMDVDVDEEDDQPLEQSFFDFKEPSPINFSTVDQAERERNFEPYGGGVLKVESPERLVQEHREAITLMAFYALKSDIPPCPREPADPYTGEHVETKLFGAPDDPKLLTRLARYQPAPVVTAPTIDVDAILRQLQPTLQPSLESTQVNDPNLAAVQNILQQVNPQYQPVPSQTQMPNFPPVPQQAAPESQQQAALTGPLYDILAQLNAHNQPAQTPTPQPFTVAPPPPLATNATDLSAIIASLQQAQQQPLNMQGYNIPPAMGTGDLYEDPERKRIRDHEREHERERDNQYGSGSDGQGQQGNKRQKTGNKGGNPNHEKKFLYQCRFFKDGKCKKGANCTFRHD